MAITHVELKNFGPIRELSWSKLGAINLVIGPNGSGKTFLLKAIYSAIRSVEETRGQEPRELHEIIADRLHWTFEADKIGDLVSKGAEGPLTFQLQFDGQVVAFQLGREATRQLQSAGANLSNARTANSIFLPAKEVLSVQPIILKSRELDKAFGFDQTYVDLARALEQSTTKGKNYSEFAAARGSLARILGGKIEYDRKGLRWQFKKGKAKFAIGATAEGIKKIAILDTLLGNRYLTPGSVVFIDEPEAALHPAAIVSLLEIVASLADRGIQFFLASHSYFVIKKLYLIARETRRSIPILTAADPIWRFEDLRDGMPQNSIVDESIKLYEKEIDLNSRIP